MGFLGDRLRWPFTVYFLCLFDKTAAKWNKGESAASLYIDYRAGGHGGWGRERCDFVRFCSFFADDMTLGL